MCTSELTELHAVAERAIELGPGAQHDRFEVEELLERYADAALARRRCEVALERDRNAALEQRLASATAVHPQTAAVLERRIAQSEALGARREALAQTSDEIADLVHWYCEHVDDPDTEVLGDGDLVATILERLDSVDAAE